MGIKPLGSGRALSAEAPPSWRTRGKLREEAPVGSIFELPLLLSPSQRVAWFDDDD